MSAQARDVPDQVGSCFGLIVPSHLLEPFKVWSISQAGPEDDI